MAVVDVGGGSTRARDRLRGRDASSWSATFRIGSGFLADSYLESDPPAVGGAARTCAATWRARSRGWSRRRRTRPWPWAAPPPRMRRLVGAELAHETLERGIRVLSQTPIADVAARFELDPERVRLLPAGILVLEALSDRLGLPLRIARGGLREGVLLELLRGARGGVMAYSDAAGAAAAIALSSDGRMSTTSSPLSSPARPPFFIRTWAPVSAVDGQPRSPGRGPTSRTSSPYSAATS